MESNFDEIIEATENEELDRKVAIQLIVIYIYYRFNHLAVGEVLDAIKALSKYYVKDTSTSFDMSPEYSRVKVRALSPTTSEGTIET